MSNDLKFKMELDSSQFEGKAKGAASSFSGIKTAIASGIGAASGMGIISMATAGIAKSADIAAAGVSKLTDFLKSCSSEAGEIELVSARLKAFTGSAALAAAAAEKVDAFSKTPPFGVKETEAAAKALLKSGTEVNNLTSELTVLGNIAAAGGISLEGMAAKYSMANESGVVSMRELRELAMGGIPIFEALGKVLGLPKDKIKEALGEERVSFANLKAAYNELGGEGKKFGKAMDEICETLPGKIMVLEGKWQDLQQTIGEGVNDAISPVMDDINKAMDRVIMGTAAGMAILQGAFTNGTLGDMIGAGFRVGIGEAINYGVGGMQAVGEALMAVLRVGGEFMGKLMGNGELGKSFSQSITTGGALLQDSINLAGIAWSKFLYSTGPVVGGALLSVIDKAVSKVSGLMGIKSETYSASQYKEQIIDMLGIRETMQGLDLEAEAARSDMAYQARRLKEPVGNILQAALETVPDNIAAEIAKIKFGKVDLVDSGKAIEEFKKLAKAANPEALQKFLAAVAGQKTEEVKQSAKLEGASSDMLAAKNDKAAKAAENLAKKLTEAAIISARANGEHKLAAKLEYKKKFAEKVKGYKEENNMSDREAKFRANEDLKNEAKMNLRMSRPGEKERQERADKLTEKQVAKTGMIGLFDDSAKKWRGGSLIPNRGSLIPDRGSLIPTRIRTDIAPLRPAEARKEEQSSLKENVASILKEIVGISAGLKTINVVN